MSTITCRDLRHGSDTLIDADEKVAYTECGVTFRNGEPWVGADRLVFSSKRAEELGRDGFSIVRQRGVAVVRSATRVARLAAILALPDMQAHRQQSLTRRLRFNHRNYKHEISIAPSRFHRLDSYTEAFWVGLCRELVRRHFNGIVFYTHGSPFYAFGDYGPFRKYAVLPDEQRNANRAQFRMILKVCKRYGLETHLQQYITKFPATLGVAAGVFFF